MHSPKRTIETDVCVVGGGLIGVAHALAARDRDLSVVLIEQDRRPRGASVRHAGHLFFTGLPGAGADTLALAARDAWLGLARRSGAPVGQDGTVIVARSDAELALLEAVAAERPARARMLTSRAAARLVPAAAERILGALHGTSDLLVDPRSVTASLTRLLLVDPRARVEFGAHVHAVEGGVVDAGWLRVRAPLVIVCPGAEPRSLGATLCAPDELVCEPVQLLRLARVGAAPSRHVITTGLALLEQPGPGVGAATEALRARLELEAPALVEHGVAPLVAPLPDGGLVVGQACRRGLGSGPFRAERLDAMLLDAARGLLGSECEVRERWTTNVLRDPADEAGVRDFHVSAPDAGVRVVRGLSQRALALCHWQAARTLQQLLDEPPVAPLAGPPALRVTDLRAHADAFRSRPGRPT